jgi:hypothetical protein
VELTDPWELEGADRILALLVSADERAFERIAASLRDGESLVYSHGTHARVLAAVKDLLARGEVGRG